MNKWNILMILKQKLLEFLENGKLIEKSEFVKEYKPTNPNLITTVVIDHIGKLKNERGYSKKERIDKMSEYLGEVRDRYGLRIAIYL